MIKKTTSEKFEKGLDYARKKYGRIRTYISKGFLNEETHLYTGTIDEYVVLIAQKMVINSMSIAYRMNEDILKNI